MLQRSVTKRSWTDPKHFITAIAIGTFIAIIFVTLTRNWSEFLLGYLWGLFIILDSRHLGNMISYRAGRRGIHGKLWIHQRTGYLMQSGRYFSITLLLLILSMLTGSIFLWGVTAAGLLSSLRQLIWLQRIPKIEMDDAPPGERETDSIIEPEENVK